MPGRFVGMLPAGSPFRSQMRLSVIKSVVRTVGQWPSRIDNYIVRRRVRWFVATCIFAMLASIGGLLLSPTRFTNTVTFVVMIVGFVIYLAAIAVSESRVRRHLRSGIPLCPICGYQLTGLEAEGHCPECGLPYAIDNVWREWRLVPGLLLRGHAGGDSK